MTNYSNLVFGALNPSFLFENCDHCDYDSYHNDYQNSKQNRAVGEREAFKRSHAENADEHGKRESYE